MNLPDLNKLLPDLKEVLDPYSPQNLSKPMAKKKISIISTYLGPNYKRIMEDFFFRYPKTFSRELKEATRQDKLTLEQEREILDKVLHYR